MQPQPSSSHTIAVISISNMIWHLGDQLVMTFMDPLIVVQTAMQMLYKDSEIPPHHRAFMTCQFSGISNPATIFIVLPDEQSHHAYVADMCHSCASTLARLGLTSVQSSLSLINHLPPVGLAW
ncbi:hypothetical protein M404DRAFT_133444 [Pisolithus tinctorius Marx 270]|uniref:Uncharacterized protein n=1 Tax=Pisolithus tinctorius Marx 270 TaxID=870435 RepID=A0A0C3PKA9_PISTI|nr:hypothetical protein M404DRAFT_133444 [Pisolithus tinctorius Marx 270]